MATTINPSEISELIKHRIEEFKLTADARNQGTITSVSDGIVRVNGLNDVMSGEMIELPGDTIALALNLERDSVGAVVLGGYEHLREGDTAKTTGRILEVPVGRELLGRVVDALGNPIDGKGPINAKHTAPIEKVAPGVIWRKSVDQPVQTGYKSVDSMIPIGRGQRELIIGDRQTGKTALADRRDHQPEGFRHQMHLRRHRPEAELDRQRRAQARGKRRARAHHHRRRLGFRIGRHAVHRALLGLLDGRVLPRHRRRRADHL